MTSTKNKGKKPKISEEEKREKIRDALMKKKSFEENALRLVEQLMSPKITREFLLQSASILNQGFYQDAVEERSLTGLCGYPVCDNIKPTFEKKGKYHISLKDKKVYDLAERKLFCSNQCFKASNFFKEQLETSPLWMLEDTNTASITLLDDKTIKKDGDRLEGEILDTSISNLEKVAVNEEIRPDLNRTNFTDQEQSKAPVSLSRKCDAKSSVSARTVVTRTIREWFTIDTYRFIYGEEDLKRRLQECGASEETWAASVGDRDLGEQYQARYRELCRTLDILDMQEEEEEERLPLPSYEVLKKHCKEENSKMEAFLAGKQSFHNSLVTDIQEKEAEDPRIPLLDHRAQLQLRRKLVLDYILRTAPEVLKLLHLRLDDIRSDLRELVNTFKLGADNVVFKSEEWTLLVVFILQLLSPKNSVVKDALEEGEHKRLLTLVLMSYQLDIAHMELIFRDITADIKLLVANC